MKIENYIESQYREIALIENIEYLNLYGEFKHERLQLIFSTLHQQFITLFKTMNDRLPTGEYSAHFWADPSRDLIKAIEITQGLSRALNQTQFAFMIDDYYGELINHCNSFLKGSGGSDLPTNMEKVNLYYTIPIFKSPDVTTINSDIQSNSYQLKCIGEGSYAKVFKYYDDHYKKNFVLKKAKKDLTPKELNRFAQEFTLMKSCNSPYIVEVYAYNEERAEYLMECMDCTLKDYIEKNNTVLSITQRKGVGFQILKAFDYIHARQMLHRDISPSNVLVKIYDDTLIIKICDFGLVKNPDIKMTSLNTEFKGYFNDTALLTEGFSTYNMLHETFAITRLLYFVLTGRTNLENIKNEEYKRFVSFGLNPDKKMRYNDCASLAEAFRQLK
ncbi:MAG: protein kinase family protein [Carnobacterium sp.]|uniref:protein kinase family protein n=1 Tax=Carnobacterium sp. TaxID=48221 RepID=UPI002FC78DA7